MSMVWLRANWAKWIVCRLLRYVSFLVELMKRDVRHAHGAHAGNQERCREPLPVDFAVELVRRLVDALHLQHPRKLLVANAASQHLFLNQSLRFFFPPTVWFGRWPTRPVWQLFHLFPSVSFERQLFWSRDSLMRFSGRIRPILRSTSLHVLSKPFFCENKMLTVTLQPRWLARWAVTAWTPRLAPRRLHTPGGGAK
ncbi:hypothetical protein PIN31115_00285 [Pandoraea iniqua]|uniref:Uncharacterized protein n=1 Tax=Pandoraea iniqua TaxID=2508288 RepID=A0A5E4RSQ4_9BURK|nr:hypothetical protein PIN31115_00285 [Pandoraea iniqua]